MSRHAGGLGVADERDETEAVRGHAVTLPRPADPVLDGADTPILRYAEWRPPPHLADWVEAIGVAVIPRAAPLRVCVSSCPIVLVFCVSS